MIDTTFITAGDAIFTVTPPVGFGAATGCSDHYTYRVEEVPAGERWGKSYFVKVLTGPDNTSDYSYVGRLNEFTGEVSLTRASQFGADTWLVKIIRRVLSAIWFNDQNLIEAAGWKVNHAGRCARCARLLTTEASVAAGYGPECLKIMAGA